MNKKYDDFIHISGDNTTITGSTIFIPSDKEGISISGKNITISHCLIEKRSSKLTKELCIICNRLLRINGLKLLDPCRHQR